MQFGWDLYPLAVVHLFSSPDPVLLQESSGTVYLCEPLDGIRVVPITSIKAVVCMFPDFKVTPTGEIKPTNKFSLMWHPFLELTRRTSSEQDNKGDDDTD